MTDSLTTLITKVQAGLGDDGTKFNTTLVTAAIRATLAKFNQAAPVHAADLFAGVNDQYEYEVTTGAVKILDVLLRGTNANEIDTPLTYDPYSEDERLFFRLRCPVTTSDTLIVRYTINHTISGLDSAIESTLPTEQDQIIVDGARAEAIEIRAVSRIETINLSKDQSDNYREVMGHFRSAFNAGLASIVKTKHAPVGEPDLRAWNDHYHSWGQ